MHELLMVLVALMAQDAVDQIPEAMRRLVCRLAAKLPGEHAEIMRETWLAELEAIPGKFPKLWFLLPLYLSQAELRRAAAGSPVQAEIEKDSDADPIPDLLKMIAGLEDQLREEKWRMQMHHKYSAMNKHWKEDAQVTIEACENSADPNDRKLLQAAIQKIRDYSNEIASLEANKMITALEIDFIERKLANLGNLHVQNEI
ncbi:hypothetical protein [Deinococcus humi]|uniref:Mlc titration factor MtfA (PtsG expression regulator) n=1 Tax=Deinococcus humi TaxID=662880 RepID=A0A7W8NHB2_9DEIO|nr:hypothetical protein [Deinococcus humi]MBB5365685.1 Mlc titration factor MtfA (ptsG expression regulator) [Deinococcus humi]GGO37120.1 hypothetical protein GCM10008949_41910 [Deinococcus humi]